MDDKSKIFNIKSFIKQENGRLTSLTVPRDLSLGGSKPKRIYTPNLNVVRNKNNKVPDSTTSKNRQRTRKTRNFDGNKNSDRYIQTSGVFSEGTANIKRPTLYSDKHASAREVDTNAGMIKPKLGNTWNVDVKQEAVVVDDLLACDDDSGSENDGEYEPIVLPLSANKDGFINTFKAKSEIDIKKERDCTEPVTNGFKSLKVKSEQLVQETFSSFTSDKTYDDDNTSVSLLKLPDSLPGKGFDDDNKLIDYNLVDMNEGQIGKILIRKSGRIDVVIGKTHYTLDTIEAENFREEVMCMEESNEVTREPAMTKLSCIDEKFVLSPIWPMLLPRKDT